MAGQEILASFKRLDQDSQLLLQNAAKHNDEEAFKVLASMVQFTVEENTISKAMTLAKYWQIKAVDIQTPQSPSSLANDQPHKVIG